MEGGGCINKYANEFMDSDSANIPREISQN